MDFTWSEVILACTQKRKGTKLVHVPYSVDIPTSGESGS